MRFKAKPWNIGTSVVVTIPYQYLRDGHIDQKKIYWWECKETEGVEDEAESNLNS